MSFLKKISPYILASIVLAMSLHIDLRVMSWMDHINANPFLHNNLHLIMPVLIFIGDGYNQIIAIGFLLVFGSFIMKDGRTLGKDLLIAFLASGIFVQIVKHIVGRARPRFLNPELFIGPSMQKFYDSFPSGHTTTAFCLAYVAAQKYPKARFAFYGVAASIGFARVLTDAHFLSDVAGGIFLGLLIGKVLWEKFMTGSALTPEEVPVKEPEI